MNQTYYDCDKCNKMFKNKSSYTRHSNRKTSCIKNVSDKKVAEEKVAEEKVAEEKVAEENVAEEKVDVKLKCISLFSGMGGDSYGIIKSGCELVAYSELEKIFQETHDLNLPNCELLGNGDITKTPDEEFSKYNGIVNLIFAGFPCFIAGTKVLTDNGYKNIEDVNLSDKLLTHTGKFQEIINLQKKVYSNNIYSLRAKYHPYHINCTENHPFYVREKIRKWNNINKNYEYIFNDPSWISAKDLTKNHFFGMKINENEIIPEFIFENKTIKLDNIDMWFMMGFFVGDGWIEDTIKKSGKSMNKIRFAINNDDENYVINRINNILNITDKKCSTGKCKKFGCSDFVWFNILKNFGKYAHGKLIPEWVQDAPKEYIQEFINGYHKADGSISKGGRHRFTTVSHNIAFGVQRLYLKLGHIFSINYTKRNPKHIIEGRNVNQRNTYQLEGYLKKIKKQHSFIEDGYAWFALFKIENFKVENEPVYNFEVANDNSYIVENIIVHNCQGFSNAGKKLPDDPRNTLFREFLRATKLVKPNFIIGENVKGLLKRLTIDGEKYIDIIKSEFENIGYDIVYDVLKCNEYGIPQRRERLIIVGIKKSLNKKFKFPEKKPDNTHLKNIIKFSMEGAIKISPEDFDMKTIPEECIICDLENDEEQHDDDPANKPHPNLVLLAKKRDYVYKNVEYPNRLSFGKRIPVGGEIIDIRKSSKTIICTYARQPRLFVPLQNKNGYYLRCLLPDELKQIQGFPKDYKLSGNKTKQIIQIGNAVPPPLIQMIVENLINI